MDSILEDDCMLYTSKQTTSIKDFMMEIKPKETGVFKNLVHTKVPIRLLVTGKRITLT